MKIHNFQSSRVALIACVAKEAVNEGDLVVIESENVIAVCDKLWSFAITENSGAFEPLKTNQSFKKKLIFNSQLIDAYIFYGEFLGKDGVHIQ